MTTPKQGILPQEERMAIFRGAKALGLDPYEFGAFLSLESGPNMDPNIVGGAGGRHKGLIQFGQNEQKTYGISGPQTRAGQMPKVLQYFQDRGYKPGMGIARAYATVLGGNPNVSLTAQDSFGTSVQSMLPRFLEGGDYYANAKRVLGDIPEDFGGTYASSPLTTTQKEFQATTQKPVTTEQRKKRATSLLSIMKDNILQQVLSNSLGRLF
jgi:hypothetical protein|tara:strand:+ start:742 stop:1374 length:633 start_codon:yes stop_codon:yes gene_type:complete